MRTSIDIDDALIRRPLPVSLAAPPTDHLSSVIMMPRSQKS
jgi:hypothetical protein